jgi:hypothetical protein
MKSTKAYYKPGLNVICALVTNLVWLWDLVLNKRSLSVLKGS